MQRTVDGSDGLSRSSGLVFFLGTGSGPRTIRSRKVRRIKGKRRYREESLGLRTLDLMKKVTQKMRTPAIIGRYVAKLINGEWLSEKIFINLYIIFLIWVFKREFYKEKPCLQK